MEKHSGSLYNIIQLGSGYFYGTVNDTHLAILTAIARCHGYHVIFCQSALSWGGCDPQTPLLLDHQPELLKTLDPKPLP